MKNSVMRETRRVGQTADQAGERAERDSDQQREECRAEADLERRLAALEQPDELVAAELAVRAEDEERRLVRRKRLRGARCVAHVGPGADRPERLAVRERERLVRPVPEHCAISGSPTKQSRTSSSEDDQARQREPVALEAAPEERPLAGRVDPRHGLDGGLGRTYVDPNLGARHLRSRSGLMTGCRRSSSRYGSGSASPGRTPEAWTYGRRTCTSVTRQSLSFCFPS